MSAENSNEGEDHAFERAISALRDVPVPDGPPRDVLAKTLSAVRAQDAPRRLSSATIVKIGIAAALGLIAFGFIWNSPPRRNQVAFADVLRAIEQVKSVKYKITSRTAGVPGEFVVECLVDDAGRMRLTEADRILIADTTQHRSLTLVPSRKEARVSDSAGVWEVHPQQRPDGSVGTEVTDMAGPETILQRLRKMPPTARSIGQRKLDNRMVEGMEAVQDGVTWRIWTDPQTKLPVRVEQKSPPIGPMPAADSVVSEIVWNEPIDEAQMSTVPPADYKVVESAPRVGGKSLQWTPAWSDTAEWNPSQRQVPALRKSGMGTLVPSSGR